MPRSERAVFIQFYTKELEAQKNASKHNSGGR